MAVIHPSITVIRLFDSMPGFPLWANDGLAAVVAAAGGWVGLFGLDGERTGAIAATLPLRIPPTLKEDAQWIKEQVLRQRPHADEPRDVRGGGSYGSQ